MIITFVFMVAIKLIWVTFKIGLLLDVGLVVGFWLVR